MTVKNTSKDEPWDGDFVFSTATETGDADVVSEVRDGSVSTVHSITGGKDLGSRQSASIKDGFSMKSAGKIKYKLEVDGLARTSSYFTR